MADDDLEVGQRCLIVDLQDPQERAEAIRDGYVWSGPMAAQWAAAEDIAAGRVPLPQTLIELLERLRALIETQHAELVALRPRAEKYRALIDGLVAIEATPHDETFAARLSDFVDESVAEFWS